MISKLRRLERVSTSNGRGRAWIRYALNESKIDLYLSSLVNNLELVQ